MQLETLFSYKQIIAKALHIVQGFCYKNDYLMPYFLLNLSTRPEVSMSFCLPV